MLHMEQKDYKLDIVDYLIKKEGHIRAIAKKLNINHMMVYRKLKSLLKENVVDFKKEGKNKIFFLKSTIEARNYIFMAENYKLIQTLKNYPRLRNIIESLQKNKKIGLVILFGSYAKGTAKKDSDIDIYIDTEDRSLKKEITLIDSKLSIKIGKYKKDSLLIKEIEKNHIIIKGIENYYEKNKFFN